jgi:hypothetical protein
MQDGLCSCRDSNRAPPKYMSEAEHTLRIYLFKDAESVIVEIYMIRKQINN